MIDSARLDLVLARHGRAIAIALVVVGVLALLASGWAVANPTTERTPQYADERVSTDVGTSAVVVQDGTLWNEGDRLENSNVYLLNETPELTVTPETRVTNTTAGGPIEDATVEHELTVRFEASRDGEAFWNESHTVLEESPSVEDGVASSEVTLDVDAYRDRQQELEREVSGVGTVDLTLELAVEYDTGTTTGTQETTAPLRVTDRAYWLEESLSASEDHSHQTGTVETTASRSPATIAGLSLFGTLALAGAVLVTRRAPVDEEAARRAVHERRYAEWISKGSIPMWIGDHQIELDSLEDVVDVAIDTNERVVHDEQRGLFAVVTDGVAYYYTEHGHWAETVWPGMAANSGDDVLDADSLTEDLDLEDDGDLPTPGDDEFDDELWEKL